MEIRITTQQVLKMLYIISWILFIGICIEAGGFLFNTFFVFMKQESVKYFWQQADLTELLQYDKGYYFTVTLTMSIVAVLRACIFFLIIKILHHKKLDMAQPFSKEVRRFIFSLSYLAVLAGIFSYWGVKNVAWLEQKGVAIPDIQDLRLGGADVWLFMGVILFVITQIFKRGIEIQSENELTV